VCRSPPTEPTPPQKEVATMRELLRMIGMHVEQYSHATRFPEAYWEEALRRDAHRPPRAL